MGFVMALYPITRGMAFLAYDDVQKMMVVCTGDVSSGEYEVIGPYAMSIGGDQGGNLMVTPDGALLVIDHSGGPPIMGTIATGADTYAQIIIAPRYCTHLSAIVATKNAILSLDGGSTDSLALSLNSFGSMSDLSGLSIQKGSVIMAKNEVAGQNYANLHVSIW